jgi:hypothetical protein
MEYNTHMNEKLPKSSHLRLVINNPEKKSLVTSENDKNAKLIDLWVGLMRSLPPEYKTACDETKLISAREEVKYLTAVDLRIYLSSLTVWQYIEYTTAVLDEVHLRVMQKDFSPRS